MSSVYDSPEFLHIRPRFIISESCDTAAIVMVTCPFFSGCLSIVCYKDDTAVASVARCLMNLMAYNRALMRVPSYDHR